MNTRQIGNTNGNDGGAPLVIMRTDDGFRVYSPANPTKSYVVSGSSANPACTCPDFQLGGENCQHIGAVLASFGRSNGATGEDRYAAEERLAIQGENGGAQQQGFSNQPPSATQMLIKRSVSPDGRIDSLSIEFSTEVDESAGAAVVSRAARLLALQAAIAKGFLDRNRNGNGNGNGARPAISSDQGANGAALAEMVNIGGMTGKWGRRLFINIQANGQSLKLFGNRAQLAEAIQNAGFPKMAERIEEDVALRVPCRVITKPSQDGKYVDIVRVLPVQAPQQGGAWR